mgnify:CR=1 FL=1
MIISVTDGNFESVHIPAGTYNASLKEVRPGKIKGMTFADGTSPDVDENGMQSVLWWSFIVRTKGDSVTLDGMTTYATGQKSKLRRWAGALGTSLSSGEFDVTRLYGKPCLVVVEDRQKPGQDIKSGIKDVVAAPGSFEEEVV